MDCDDCADQSPRQGSRRTRRGAHQSSDASPRPVCARGAQLVMGAPRPFRRPPRTSSVIAPTARRDAATQARKSRLGIQFAGNQPAYTAALLLEAFLEPAPPPANVHLGLLYRPARVGEALRRRRRAADAERRHVAGDLRRVAAAPRGRARGRLRSGPRRPWRSARPPDATEAAAARVGARCTCCASST